MMNPAHPQDPGLGWAFVYHQGVPVAICPVHSPSPEGDALHLACGPLDFEIQTPLVLHFTDDGKRLAATVEDLDSRQVWVRIQSGEA